MALNPTRFRRILSFSSFLTLHKRLPSTTINSLSSLIQAPHSSSPQIPNSFSSSRFFHSTHFSLSSSRSFNDVEKIDPDTILFEGCDYKHWLIVMDFGNDPHQRPPAEQMVETYVQTLAKVVGSVEEAKKRMYACSTTTYTGFQAEMDEETSNKFEGMPGVVFVLPDSYIDPVNKEYGGDKYINGTIIPRPPPVQYGRVKRGRQNDQRPSGQMPYQQGDGAYNQRQSMPGEGRGMPQGGASQRQHFPPNYGPPYQRGRSNPMSKEMNYSEQGRDSYQGGGNTYALPHRGNYNHGYTHPRQMENHPSNVPCGQVNNPQVEHGYNHPQRQIRNTAGGHDDYTPQRQMTYPEDNSNFAPPPARGSNGHTGVGSYQQHEATRYMQGPSVPYDQVASPGYHGSPSQVENSTVSQLSDERNITPAENRNHTPATQSGINQGRF